VIPSLWQDVQVALLKRNSPVTEREIFVWSARTCPRFGTGRHVARKKSGVMPPHSKIAVRRFCDRWKRFQQSQSTSGIFACAQPVRVLCNHERKSFFHLNTELLLKLDKDLW